MTDYKKIVYAYLITQGSLCRCMYKTVPSWNPVKMSFDVRTDVSQTAATDILLDKLEDPVIEYKRAAGKDARQCTVLYGAVPLKDGTQLVYGVVDPDTYIINLLAAKAVIPQIDYHELATTYWRE